MNGFGDSPEMANRHGNVSRQWLAFESERK